MSFSKLNDEFGLTITCTSLESSTNFFVRLEPIYPVDPVIKILQLFYFLIFLLLKII